jgi:hypothetical protein
LRPAENQQRKRARLATLRRYFKKLAPYRIAGHDCFAAEVRQSLFERNGRAIYKTHEHTVGPTRQRV